MIYSINQGNVIDNLKRFFWIEKKSLKFESKLNKQIQWFGSRNLKLHRI